MLAATVLAGFKPALRYPEAFSEMGPRQQYKDVLWVFMDEFLGCCLVQFYQILIQEPPEADGTEKQQPSPAELKTQGTADPWSPCPF